MDTAWAEALLDICLRDGAAVLLKQMGSRLAAELGVRGKGCGETALLRGRRWAVGGGRSSQSRPQKRDAG